jgi:hypothetical protein
MIAMLIACIGLVMPSFVMADSSSSVNGVAAVVNQNYQASDLNGGRGFAIPGQMLFPGTPGYYGAATPGHRFIPLSKLLMYTTAWKVSAAKNMLKGRTGSKDIEIRDLMADTKTKPTDIVYCSILSPVRNGGEVDAQISIGTIAATGGKSISADVFAEAIVKASERGANYIQFMAEGVNREVNASGFGIGFNTTQAQIYSGDNSKSNISTGGFGYSHGWAGYIDYPWLQFTFLKVDGLHNMVMGFPPAAANEKTAVNEGHPLSKTDIIQKVQPETKTAAPLN